MFFFYVKENKNKIKIMTTRIPGSAADVAASIIRASEQSVNAGQALSEFIREKDFLIPGTRDKFVKMCAGYGGMTQKELSTLLKEFHETHPEHLPAVLKKQDGSVRHPDSWFQVLHSPKALCKAWGFTHIGQFSKLPEIPATAATVLEAASNYEQNADSDEIPEILQTLDFSPPRRAGVELALQILKEKDKELQNRFLNGCQGLGKSQGGMSPTDMKRLLVMTVSPENWPESIKATVKGNLTKSALLKASAPLTSEEFCDAFGFLY
jgi:hypothetical protein